MNSFITHTGSFLPGPAISNDEISTRLGVLDGEDETKRTVLKMNGIVSRHYAQDENQQQTFDVYDLASKAVANCTCSVPDEKMVDYLAVGTTYAPLGGPGIASILHSRLHDFGIIKQPLEISSHSGICSSAAAALVSAIRAVHLGDHRSAISVGSEHPSVALKAAAIKPYDDREQHAELRKSKWFMQTFLRFMLSDGAGAFVIENEPKPDGVSLQVDWTHSMSFANQAPLCMKLEHQGVVITQDISILSKYLFPAAHSFVANALEKHDEELDSYDYVLPHMSSFFFRRKMERVIRQFTKRSDSPLQYWTNLATAGNTGSASIYIMLDQFLKEHQLNDGDRLLLFIPESGQFNFVMVSLTAVVRCET